MLQPFYYNVSLTLLTKIKDYLILIVIDSITTARFKYLTFLHFKEKKEYRFMSGG